MLPAGDRGEAQAACGCLAADPFSENHGLPVTRTVLLSVSLTPKVIIVKEEITHQERAHKQFEKTICAILAA